MNNLESINKLLNDSSFVKNIIVKETDEDVIDEFRKKDIEITQEELDYIVDIIIKTNQRIKQLNDGDLASVSGGILDASYDGDYDSDLIKLEEGFFRNPLSLVKVPQQADSNVKYGNNKNVIIGVTAISGVIASGVGLGLWLKKRMKKKK